MTSPLNGEQLRIVNEELFTALESSDFSDRIDLCLKKGANINARDSAGRTLLMVAVWKESSARVRYVLGKKPDLFLKDTRGRTAFDMNKETRDNNAKTTITQLLLQAMPDASKGQAAAPPPPATPPVAPAPPAEDIMLAPPLQIKSRKKPGGGPTGGFRL